MTWEEVEIETAKMPLSSELIARVKRTLEAETRAGNTEWVTLCSKLLEWYRTHPLDFIDDRIREARLAVGYIKDAEV